MNGIAGKRVMVTGGGGFLGRAVVERVTAAGAADVFVPRSAALRPAAARRASMPRSPRGARRP